MIKENSDVCSKISQVKKLLIHLLKNSKNTHKEVKDNEYQFLKFYYKENY
jgi:hypothetical protein